MTVKVDRSNSGPGPLRAHIFGMCAAAGFLVSGGASAEGDIALGQYLSSECVTCHQLSGKSVGAIPPIVGWPSDQFVAVVDSYRKKERDNEVMRTIAARLSDEEISALAAYFGSLKAVSD